MRLIQIESLLVKEDILSLAVIIFMFVPWIYLQGSLYQGHN